MAAALNLHFPRIRQQRPRRTIKERAKALASTTAKILHFPSCAQNRPHPDQALVEMAAQWDAQKAAIDAHDSDHDPDGLQALVDELDAIERRIGRIEPTTLDGLNIKARVAAQYVDADFDPDNSSSSAVGLGGLVNGVFSVQQARQWPTALSRGASASEQGYEGAAAVASGRGGNLTFATLDDRFAYLEEVERRSDLVADHAATKSAKKNAELAVVHVVRQQTNILLEIASRRGASLNDFGHKARIIAASMRDLWRSEDEKDSTPFQRAERMALRALLDELIYAAGLERPAPRDSDPADILAHGIHGAPDRED